jgi:hypothetical protein
VFLYTERRANILRVYITEQDTGLRTPSFPNIHRIMDSKATDNVPRESDTFLSYNPTDPNLRDSPALVHLQRCILQVSAQAVGSGQSLSQVQSRLAQHQTQFDAFLETLDALSRTLEAGLTTAVRNDNAGAALLDAAHEQVRTRQRPERPGTVTAVNAAASAPPQGDFTDTPQFDNGDPDGSRSRTRRMKGVAAQQDLSDENWRAAHFGNWLGDLPESFDNIAQVGHDTQDDTKIRETRSNDRGKSNASANQVDEDSVNPPSIDYPTSDPLPYFTRSESEVLPRGDFENWAEQKRYEFRRNMNPRAYGDSEPKSQ